jgi:UDP-N-acetylglucosamine--N-acetylmuramyl-(pentapeptide) pyrophosphoryl-undecaprenol N-acetylglucosamine transferase
MGSPEPSVPPLRLLFAGGGTGGHLYPALAIAEELRRQQPLAEIAFVGSRRNLEARLVPAHGFPFFPISVAGFRRQLSLEMLTSVLKVVVAMVQSFLVIRKIRPHTVVGTGGYVCGPPLAVAAVLGIPTLIQEQNSYPGLTTRLLASRATEVHLSFERSRRFLSARAHLQVSGNPTRAAIGRVGRAEGAEALQVDPTGFTLLVFGGSQGARSINDAVLSSLGKLKNMQMVWVTGTEDFGRIQNALRAGTVEHGPLSLRPYIEQMENAYAVADLVVCRAGATTIAEIARAGLPSLLVPYPFATADHQMENAKAMEESGAAVVLRDTELPDRLVPVLTALARDRERLRDMASHAARLGAPHATEVLAEAVMRLAGERRG